jgi:hypothetical protein
MHINMHGRCASMAPSSPFTKQEQLTGATLTLQSSFLGWDETIQLAGRPLFGLSYQPRMMMMMMMSAEQLVKWLEGKAEVLGENLP